jgi:hypothetical protein
MTLGQEPINSHFLDNSKENRNSRKTTPSRVVIGEAGALARVSRLRRCPMALRHRLLDEPAPAWRKRHGPSTHPDGEPRSTDRERSRHNTRFCHIVSTGPHRPRRGFDASGPWPLGSETGGGTRVQINSTRGWSSAPLQIARAELGARAVRARAAMTEFTFGIRFHHFRGGTCL